MRMEKVAKLRNLMNITLVVISITWTEMLSFTLQSTCLAVVHSFLKMREKAKGAHGQITSLPMGICILEGVMNSLQKMQRVRN